MSTRDKYIDFYQCDSEGTSEVGPMLGYMPGFHTKEHFATIHYKRPVHGQLEKYFPQGIKQQSIDQPTMTDACAHH